VKERGRSVAGRGGETSGPYGRAGEKKGPKEENKGLPFEHQRMGGEEKENRSCSDTPQRGGKKKEKRRVKGMTPWFRGGRMSFNRLGVGKKGGERGGLCCPRREKKSKGGSLYPGGKETQHLRGGRESFALAPGRGKKENLPNSEGKREGDFVSRGGLKESGGKKGDPYWGRKEERFCQCPEGDEAQVTPATNRKSRSKTIGGESS